MKIRRLLHIRLPATGGRTLASSFPNVRVNSRVLSCKVTGLLGIFGFVFLLFLLLRSNKMPMKDVNALLASKPTVQELIHGRHLISIDEQGNIQERMLPLDPSPSEYLQWMNQKTEFYNQKSTNFEYSFEDSEREDNVVEVIFAASEDYFVALMAALHSIQLHSVDCSIRFHVVVPESSLHKLKALLSHSARPLKNTSKFPRMFNGSRVSERLSLQYPLEVVVFKPDRVQQLLALWVGDETRHLNALNYARFYLPYIFPHLQGTVIYLDPDLVVQTSLLRLWSWFQRRTDPSNSGIDSEEDEETEKSSLEESDDLYFAAVAARDKPGSWGRYCFMLACDDTDIAAVVKNPNAKFFNAGVFITNIDRWRQDRITEQLEKWLGKNRERQLWRWGSQAPLALVFYDKWIKLRNGWNFRSAKNVKSMTFFENNLNYVNIYHFAGEEKPWGFRGHTRRLRRVRLIWCRYSPQAHLFWFCRPDGEQGLVPKSVMDFSFVKYIFMKLTEDEALVS